MRYYLNKLIEYGLGSATILVLTLCGVCLYLVVGAAVIITKFLMFIK
jgi:hypothetical protein